MTYASLYQRSIDDPDTFWSEQARRIDWHHPFSQVLDYSNPPFTKWFVGGTTNVCHNAVDRWVTTRGEQSALIAISTETNTERVYTYSELQTEVIRTAAILQALGVGQGDRVLIYMPMIAEAIFTMLACARIGAVHSVVFGGFAAHSLVTRIEDVKPVLIVSADAGSRSGKVMPYKGLLDDAIAQSSHKPAHVLMVNRGLADMPMTAGRDLDYAGQRALHLEVHVPCVWLESNALSYVLYTSGTTGKPKGVQRDVGGHAVALATSMDYIFCGKAGGTFFCTADIGWAVGHSYLVYGPLIAGMTTILYEGLPIVPDGGIWWSIVEQYKVTHMFSAPTAIRVLKKQPPELLKKYDVSSLQALFLAGEPLDETTSNWIAEGLGVPVIDNYWQTESGWPMMTIAKNIEDKPTRLGSPGVPMYGYNIQLVNESTGALCAANEKGVLVVEGPLPPGCLQTIYGDDARYVSTYWSGVERPVYSTFDWGIRDEDGYYFILGRTDDVINVAGHRLGTREIEESISSHSNVSEVAVVGVEDQLKGQVAVAFVILKDASGLIDDAARRKMEKDIMGTVDQQIGAVGRPARVYFVSLLPKTRSGKLLRRLIQAICEGRDPGDLTTIEDPGALQQIREALAL